MASASATTCSTASSPSRRSFDGKWYSNGDTTLILHHLGLDLEAGLDARARAEGLALRCLLEEHWHQVLEYELFVDPIGRRGLQRELRGSLALPLAWLVGRMLHRHFKRHLVERGIARHTPAEIALSTRADIDAVVAWLDGRTWAVADRPTLTDASLFGLLAPGAWSTADTPAFGYLRRQPVVMAYLERVRARYFPEVAAAGVNSPAGSDARRLLPWTGLRGGNDPARRSVSSTLAAAVGECSFHSQFSDPDASHRIGTRSPEQQHAGQPAVPIPESRTSPPAPSR